MAEITEGNWTFVFPETWQVSKFDNWKFYRQTFQGLASGKKAIDILAFDTQNKTTWLIEVKDYRSAPRLPEKEKSMPLAEEIALKVMHTLAGIFATCFQANLEAEQRLASNVLKKSKQLKVAFHLIQPDRATALNPRPQNIVGIRQNLRQRLRAVDPHPCVRGLHDDMPWQVVRAK